MFLSLVHGCFSRHWTADSLSLLLDSSPPEAARTQQQSRSNNMGAFDKFRHNIDSPLLEQPNRRPGSDRHVSRNSATSLSHPPNLKL